MTQVATHRLIPRRRSGHTTSVTVGGERFYVTTNSREDGSLGELTTYAARALPASPPVTSGAGDR